MVPRTGEPLLAVDKIKKLEEEFIPKSSAIMPGRSATSGIDRIPSPPNV
jgi:hypothetical protein